MFSTRVFFALVALLAVAAAFRSSPLGASRVAAKAVRLSMSPVEAAVEAPALMAQFSQVRRLHHLLSFTVFIFLPLTNRPPHTTTIHPPVHDSSCLPRWTLAATPAPLAPCSSSAPSSWCWRPLWAPPPASPGLNKGWSVLRKKKQFLNKNALSEMTQHRSKATFFHSASQATHKNNERDGRRRQTKTVLKRRLNKTPSTPPHARP